jgi:carboxylesterase type B
LLWAAINAVGAKAPLPSSIWPWQPVVDGKFVADYPSKLTAAGKFTKVPMIMGFTTDEVTCKKLNSVVMTYTDTTADVIPTVFNISTDAFIVGLASCKSYNPPPFD